MDQSQWNKLVKETNLIVDRLREGCSEDEFSKFRCPACGSLLLLAFHPKRHGFFLHCKQDSTHLAVHREVNHWVDWWGKFISEGWYSERCAEQNL
jgi:hypothetical protein